MVGAVTLATPVAAAGDGGLSSASAAAIAAVAATPAAAHIVPVAAVAARVWVAALSTGYAKLAAMVKAGADLLQPPPAV